MAYWEKSKATLQISLQNFFKPNEGLPTRRVVLVGSLSRLGTCEISSHMEDLVHCITFILAWVGKGTVVITFIPMPLGGTWPQKGERPL